MEENGESRQYDSCLSLHEVSRYKERDRAVRSVREERRMGGLLHTLASVTLTLPGHEQQAGVVVASVAANPLLHVFRLNACVWRHHAGKIGCKGSDVTRPEPQKVFLSPTPRFFLCDWRSFKPYNL